MIGQKIGGTPIMSMSVPYKLLRKDAALFEEHIKYEKEMRGEGIQMAVPFAAGEMGNQKPEKVWEIFSFKG